VLHVEECIVIGVFWVAAVFVLITGTSVNIIKDVICGNGLGLVLVEALIE
jgi:hypothetical protein